MPEQVPARDASILVYVPVVLVNEQRNLSVGSTLADPGRNWRDPPVRFAVKKQGDARRRGSLISADSCTFGNKFRLPGAKNEGGGHKTMLKCFMGPAERAIATNLVEKRDNRNHLRAGNNH